LALQKQNYRDNEALDSALATIILKATWLDDWRWHVHYM